MFDKLKYEIGRETKLSMRDMILKAVAKFYGIKGGEGGDLKPWKTKDISICLISIRMNKMTFPKVVNKKINYF